MATPVRAGTSSSGKTSGAAGSCTISHTATGDPLIVQCTVWQGNVTTMTYGGVALLLGGRQTSGNMRAEWWYLAAPTPGTADIVITIPATWVSAECHNIANTVATNAALAALVVSGAQGSSGASSVTIASRIGDFVLDMTAGYGSGTTFTPGAGQTKIHGFDSIGGTDVKTASSEKAGGLSVTMAWTFSVGSDWAALAIAFPDPSVPPSVGFPTYVGQASNANHTGSSVTSLSTTPAFNLAAGNAVSVVVRQGAGVTSVTDLAGNVYTKDGSGDTQHQIWSCKNALPHAANIVTANFPLSSYVNITALQFKGGNPTTLLDVYTTGNISGNVTVSCTPVGTNWDQIVVAAASIGAAGSATFPAGFTVVYNGGSSSVAYAINPFKTYDGTRAITATFGGTQAKTISVSIYNATLATAPDVVSQINAELVRSGLGDLRVTQLNVELVRQNTYPPAGARVTQHIVELISLPAAPGRVTQMAVEVLSLPPAPARVSQMAVEVLTIPSPPSRITQLAVELLMPSPPSGENTSLWID
jgi:hypothetical protein